MLLYERICLSGLDTGGSCGRYLASFLKGQIAMSGGTEGTGTYILPPTVVAISIVAEAKAMVNHCPVELVITLENLDRLSIHPNFCPTHDTGHDFIRLDIIDHG